MRWLWNTQPSLSITWINTHTSLISISKSLKRSMQTKIILLKFMRKNFRSTLKRKRKFIEYFMKIGLEQVGIKLMLKSLKKSSWVRLMKSMKCCLNVLRRSFNRTIKILKRKSITFLKLSTQNQRILKKVLRLKTSLQPLNKRWRVSIRQFRKSWASLVF